MIGIRKKSFWTIFIGIFFVNQAIFAALLWLLPPDTAYRFGIKRLHYLTSAEFLMSLLSLLIWLRINSLVRTLCAGTGRLTQDLLASGALMLVASAQFCLLCHYFLQGEEPHWFSLFSMFSASLHVHLSAFLLGFVLIESVSSFLGAGVGRIGTNLLGCFQWLLTDRGTHTLLSLALSFLLTLFGAFSVSLGPSATLQTVTLRNLPTKFHGFRIALVTDIHVGATVGRSNVQRIVGIVNSLKPDLVAIAGDLVDGSVESLRTSVEPLRDLNATLGSVYSTGNHEYYHGDADDWLRLLGTLGITVLHNSNRKLRRGHSELCVAGVDDIFAVRMGAPNHSMDPKKAVDGCDSRFPIVMLVHQPNGVKKILADSPNIGVDLFLSGHTHGGQLYVVFPIAYLTNAYFLGLYKSATGAQIYVSSGVNFWGPPVKMFGMSEVCLLTLLPP